MMHDTFNTYIQPAIASHGRQFVAEALADVLPNCGWNILPNGNFGVLCAPEETIFPTPEACDTVLAAHAAFTAKQEKKRQLQALDAYIPRAAEAPQKALQGTAQEDAFLLAKIAEKEALRATL